MSLKLYVWDGRYRVRLLLGVLPDATDTQMVIVPLDRYPAG